VLREEEGPRVRFSKPVILTSFLVRWVKQAAGPLVIDLLGRTQGIVFCIGGGVTRCKCEATQSKK